MTTTQGVKLDAATRERLKALAKLKQRSSHWLMRTAIERFLEHEERYEREKQEDMARWQEYQLTGRATSHEDAAKWLNELAESKSVACPK